MITKVLIFGLLCSTARCATAIQALPSTDGNEVSGENNETHPASKVVPEGQLYCAPKIKNYKEKMEALEKMLESYTKLVDKHELDPADKVLLKLEHNHVKNITDNFVAKFNPDLDKLRHTFDNKARYEFCKKEMNVYEGIKGSLTLAARDFKKEVFNILNHTSGVHQNIPTDTPKGTTPVTSLARYPAHVRSDFEKVLTEVVNWLFIIDIGSNILVSTAKLLKKLYSLVKNKISLEKEWKITPEGEVEVPEKIEVVYDEGDIVVDKELDNKIEVETTEILEHTAVDAAEASAAERAKLLEEAGETEVGVETEAESEGAWEKVEEELAEFGELIK